MRFEEGGRRFGEDGRVLRGAAGREAVQVALQGVRKVKFEGAGEKERTGRRKRSGHCQREGENDLSRPPLPTA